MGNRGAIKVKSEFLQTIQPAWLKRWGQRAADRFWAKIKVQQGCWCWTGVTTLNGTPLFELGGKPQSARRVAWEMQHGPVPPDQTVKRKRACAQPGCVNPAHASIVPSDQSLPNAKLADDEVVEIRALVDYGISPAWIARHFEIDPDTVYRIASRKIWAHLPQPEVVNSALYATLPDRVSGLTAVQRQTLMRLVDHCAELSERERALLVRHFGLDDRPPETLQSLADRDGISREAVRQVQAQALQRLRVGRTLAQLRRNLDQLADRAK